MAPAHAAVTVASSPSVIHASGNLVQTVQHYGYPRYYGSPRFYGRPRFYGPGPGHYGSRRYHGVPRFYGPSYYGRRGHHR